MTTVTFTREVPVASLAVDEAYYNANDKTLTLDLNDRVYRYSGVPQSVVDNLETCFPNGVSVGRYWLPDFKRNYGPGEPLGWYDEVHYERAADRNASQTVEVTPKGLTDNTTSEPHLSLVASAPAGVEVSVVFEVNGATKTHTGRYADLLDAVKSVKEFGEMLGIDFVLKSATVSNA